MEDLTKKIRQSMEKMDASLRSFLMSGIIFLFFSIISCSSQAPEDKTPAQGPSEGVDMNSVKIKGVTITVGESADTVYDRIGTGDLTTAANDPANPKSILKLHYYVSEGKKYRIFMCKTEGLGFDHVCRISVLKLPQDIDFNAQPEAERSLNTKDRRPRNRSDVKIDNSKSAPKVFTDEDLKKYGTKK